MDVRIHSDDAFIRKGIEDCLDEGIINKYIGSDLTVDIYIIPNCYTLLRWGRLEELMSCEYAIIMGNESVMRAFMHVFEHQQVYILNIRCQPDILVNTIKLISDNSDFPVRQLQSMELTFVELSVLWKINNIMSRDYKLSKYDSRIKRRAMHKLNVQNNTELFIKFNMLSKICSWHNRRLVRYSRQSRSAVKREKMMEADMHILNSKQFSADSN
ncbi:hypothetical protein OGV43_05505 [Citrobacter sp. Cb003]|uniref:hypothetical protein n=1 Tax=Citrobacter sp. Cb003 TaxID=2985005 RepID=UPI00257EBA54|nr:hypothetical protein [Citrobacter sp. Cb003]MDM3379279.1 hypothetical protein [Citrobacter sp. Cb003]